MRSRINFEVRIAAPPEEVFAYLTEPEKMRTWLAEMVEADPRPGGALRLSGGNVMAGEFLEVVPNRRVVFTWGWEKGPPVPPGSTTVEIDLEPDREGTLLRLQHRDLPRAQSELHAAGWRRALPKLSDSASRR